MSLTFALWSARESANLSRALCYLLLSAGAETPELAPIDAERVEALLRERLAVRGSEEEPEFDYQLLPCGVLIETHRSAGPDVAAFLYDLARHERLEFFDPESESVTDDELEACNSRLRAAEASEQRSRWPRELAELRARAATGDAKAMVELGNRYAFGEGVPVSADAAVAWYRKAAGLGHPDGMFNLATCYRQGEGVAKDPALAVKWYQCALPEDPLFAAFALGEMLAFGEGIARDVEAAIRYFYLALENGHQDARRELRKLGALPPLPEA